MQLTDLQRATIRAILSLFETGSPRGDYAAVTLVKGDTGGLSFGIKQATRASGNLGLLVQAYCDAEWALYADELRAYIPRLLDGDPTLDEEAMLTSLLRIAAVDDPVMREVQDKFFDRVFLDPAIRECERRGFEHALTACVVYDSLIHGSFDRIAARVPPTMREREWCFAYVDERARWLANHSNQLLRRTVYRTAALRNLAVGGKWHLVLPLAVRGVRLTPEVVLGEDLAHASADTSRLLRLRSPRMTGADVDAVRGALFLQPGEYDEFAADAVRVFQASTGLKDDGMVGPATRTAMGL